MSTPAQLAANQANAQLSTGPTSATGKSKSSLNAVKTGLTGHTVLLASDDAELYQAHLARFTKRYEPVGEDEGSLVQALADTEWRLQRIPGLEMGIYAVGRLEFAELYPNEEEAVRKHLIEARVLVAYQRQISNLGIQENRLRRQKQKDSAALKELQENRKRATAARLDKAARQYITAVYEKTNHSFDPAKLGFEFSIGQIEVRAMALDSNLFADYERELAKKLKLA